MCEVPHKDKRCPHTDANGGVSTNFDPYGTRKELGLPVEEWQHICWPCYGAWGQEKDMAYRKETDLAARTANQCGFLEAWIGHCKEQRPCKKHGNQTCFKCEKPATRNCSETSSLVCGVPECDEHSHFAYHRYGR